MTLRWLPLAAIFSFLPAKLQAQCDPFIATSLAAMNNAPPQYLSLNEEVLWQDLLMLSDKSMEGRRGGTRGSEKARQYIMTRFEQAQLEGGMSGQGKAAWLHRFTIDRFLGDAQGINVVAKVTGTDNPEKMIVVTAHYDHLGKIRGDIYPGANDNATGVAAMISLAAAIAKSPLAHTVLFVATDYEEAGLYGARAFIEESVVPLNQILLNVNLDMFGQPGKLWTLYVTGTNEQPQYRPLVERVAQSQGFCLHVGRDKPSRSYDKKTRVDWKKASDHYEFHKVGIPWLFIGVKDYKYYHSTSDKPEKLSRPFYAAATLATLALIVEIDTFHNREK